MSPKKKLPYDLKLKMTKTFVYFSFLLIYCYDDENNDGGGDDNGGGDECAQDRECVQGEGREQFSGVYFLLPPRRFWGWNSRHRACASSTFMR